METRAQDRRAEPRVAYVAEVSVEGTRGASDRIGDLSKNGAFVETMSGFPIGSQLTLAFRLPEREIRVTAETRYVMPHIGMGVRFLDLTEEDRSSIERFVRSQALGQPTAT